jgi:hypothetical protein
MSNQYHRLIVTLLSLLGTAGVSHAVDVRLQLSTTPGFDKNDEEFKSSNNSTEYTLDQDEGVQFGLMLTWVEPVGVSFLRGVEVNYRTEGGTNAVGDDLKTTQIGGGGRLGLGWVITPGLRLEAGGRATVGYAETDDAQDSYGPAGNVLIVYAIHESLSGWSYQAGAFLGLNYTTSHGLLIGIELGYEYTCAMLENDGINHTVSGSGATGGINVGYSF